MRHSSSPACGTAGVSGDCGGKVRQSELLRGGQRSESSRREGSACIMAGAASMAPGGSQILPPIITKGSACGPAGIKGGSGGSHQGDWQAMAEGEAHKGPCWCLDATMWLPLSGGTGVARQAAPAL